MKIEEARAIVAKYRPPYTAMQKAMRKALGVTTTNKRRRRKRKRRKYEPTKRELDECRKQRLGVHIGE